jgi:hypothetical protein
MIERKQDRRRSVSSHFTRPQADRRRPNSDRRACAAPLTWAAVQPGAIRPGVGEELPPRERRRYPDSGME